LNPFFIVWWLTVGSNLILISLEFASIAGVIFMYVCHVWMDYVWLMIVAHIARVGTNIAGFKWYRLVLVLFGMILIYFGFTFIVNSIP
jgi:threonine/homoserine/homoserine lactone efflux protein